MASPPQVGGSVGRPPDFLSNVQILRGIAAAMVLVYHLGNELADRGFAGPFPDVGVGSAGVDIFFVVSGFVMVHSTEGAFRAPGAPSLFLARRAVRIVPLYWLVTTGFVIVTALSRPPADPTSDLIGWLAASYAFLFYPHFGGGDFPFYAPGWTLNFEMFFYLCFAAALFLRRTTALWSLTLGLAALAALGALAAPPWPLTRLTDTNILEFVLGAGLAVVYDRGIRLSPWMCLALAAGGIATFAATIGSVDDWLAWRGLVWGPPASAVVAAAALWRPGAAADQRRTWRSALEALGDASYSLYLVHYAVFVALGDAVERFVPVASLPPAAYASACALAAVSLSLAVHRWVERPLVGRLNAAFDLPRRWKAVTARVPASG